MTPDKQLAGFIAKFAVANQRLIRGLRRAMRRRLPWANELVYDNYNFMVIGYSPTERPTDSAFSLAADAHGVILAFGYNGTKLADPAGILQGTGKLNRFVRLSSPNQFDEPALSALIDAAVKLSKAPTKSQKGTLIIRSVSAKQRPRRIEEKVTRARASAR